MGIGPLRQLFFHDDMVVDQLAEGAFGEECIVEVRELFLSTIRRPTMSKPKAGHALFGPL